MTPRIRIAVMLTAFLAAAPHVHAQAKPISTAGPVPFHTGVEVTRDVSANQPFSFLDATLRDAVPVGKRLVVEYVSVRVESVTAFLTPALTTCQLRGNLNGVGVEQLIPVVIGENPIDRTVTHFTGGQQLTMYLDAGPIIMSCSADDGNNKLFHLVANVTGQLISN
jgi:hypothetical protein